MMKLTLSFEEQGMIGRLDRQFPDVIGDFYCDTFCPQSVQGDEFEFSVEELSLIQWCIDHYYEVVAETTNTYPPGYYMWKKRFQYGHDSTVLDARRLQRDYDNDCAACKSIFSPRKGEMFFGTPPKKKSYLKRIK